MLLKIRSVPSLKNSGFLFILKSPSRNKFLCSLLMLINMLAIWFFKGFIRYFSCWWFITIIFLVFLFIISVHRFSMCSLIIENRFVTSKIKNYAHISISLWIIAKYLIGTPHFCQTNQYIKDCEAGAGRTPSVRRRK